jgi:sugar phosphate isomerase/epimerase
MAVTRRNWLKLSTGTLLAQALKAKGLPVSIGVTDWNLRQEAKLEALALAHRLGFDGVEISIGIGAERLPLGDSALQQQYVAEAKKLKFPIPSTCLNILHRNILKSDKLAQRWVADSIPITRAVGARVILLPFFGKGALKTREEMDYVADFLREIAREAEKAKVVLGLENTCSAEDNAHMLGRARSKAVRVYYDIGNSTQGGFDVVREIRWLGKDRICQFHIKDNPQFLGQGKIDIPAVVDAIADIGFRGWAHLETSSPTKSVEADMAVNLKYIREVFAKRAAEG